MLSIIVTWRDRIELSMTIDSMIDCVSMLGGEVVIVNFSGDEQMLRSQLPTNESIRIVNVSGEKFFNKSAAQNVGALSASYEILFFCDCDIIVERQEMIALVNSVSSERGIFATVAGVTETVINSRNASHVTKFGYTLNICTADGRELLIVDNEEDGKNGTRQAPGLLVVRKADLFKIDGYNGELKGWGWEDQDMIARLTLGLGLKRVQLGNFLHVSHDDTARMVHYPAFSSRWESRDRMFRKALENYDNNNFLGSLDRDRQRFSADIVGPD